MLLISLKLLFIDLLKYSLQNKEQLPERINKTHLIDKTNSKQIQQLKTTPSSKIKMQLPVSINRLLQNSSNTLLNVRLILSNFIFFLVLYMMCYIYDNFDFSNQEA